MDEYFEMSEHVKVLDKKDEVLNHVLQEGEKMKMLNCSYDIESDLEERPEGKLAINGRDVLYVLPVNDLLYLQAEGPCTKIIFASGELVASKNLKHYQDKLEGLKFIRVHHSYLVNACKIVSVNKKKGVAFLMNGEEVPVSARKKDQLVKDILRFFAI